MEELVITVQRQQLGALAGRSVRHGTKSEQGRVVMDLILAISRTPLSTRPLPPHAALCAVEQTPLSDWTLRVENWGSGGDPLHPEGPPVTEIDFGKVSLGYWNALTMNEAQRKALGVEGMHQAAGFGKYTASFTLNRAWREVRVDRPLLR